MRRRKWRCKPNEKAAAMLRLVMAVAVDDKKDGADAAAVLALLLLLCQAYVLAKMVDKKTIFCDMFLVTFFSMSLELVCFCKCPFSSGKLTDKEEYGQRDSLQRFVLSLSLSLSLTQIVVGPLAKEGVRDWRSVLIVDGEG
jgi:hypothetical protein